MNIHFLTETQDPNIAILQSMLSKQVNLTAGLNVPHESDFEVLIAGRPTAEQLAASQRLQTLFIPFAGLPEQTRQVCLQNPHITVYNLHHNALITAELALALLFSAAKFVVQHDQQLRRNDWTLRYRKAPSSILLSGKTVLLVGYGHIGRRIAEMCAALGMQVVVIRRNPNAQTGHPHGRVFADRQDLIYWLKKTNVLMIACPLTGETRGMIAENELRSMPPGGILVNVGRGAVVDQQSLYQALNDGHLAAAGLDVWYNYPDSEASRSYTAPADYPFQELDQVIMSPHRGGLSRETEMLRMTDLAALLNRMASGADMPPSVDVAAGY
jgi:phosphoglycerate dehydrogenase-like enzyme